MKKILVFFVLLLIILNSSGCSMKTDDISDREKENTIIATETTIDTATNDTSSIKEVIKKYCDNYLSLEGTSKRNLEAIRECLTDYYYQQLQAQEGHTTEYASDYVQSTSIEELYYGEKLLNSTANVAAVCNQTIITNNETVWNTIIYKFSLIMYNSKWQIDNVEIIKE